MTKGPEWKNVLLFTLPIMAGSLLQQLFLTVDGVVLGNFVGQQALAAVVTTQSLAFLYLALAIGMSVGTGIIIAQYFGAGKHDLLPTAIDTSLIMLGVCGLILTVIAQIISPFLLRVVLNVDTAILPMSIAYFRIYSFALFFQFVYNGVAAILRGVGDSKATLYFLIIATLVSMGLNFLFVVGFGWNVRGVAFATVMAQAACATVSYIYLRRKFPFVKSGIHWDRKVAGTMAKLGLPITLQYTMVSFGNGAMQRLVNGFGYTVTAAFGAANQVDFFVFAMIMSFLTGVSGFTGQNIGAGRLDRVKRGYRSAFVICMSITIIMSAGLYIFAAPAVSIFGLYGDALHIGVQQIRFLSLFFWMFAGYITLAGVLQGAGDTLLQSVATVLALVVRIVTAYIAVGMGWLGYSAAWETTPFGWVLAIVITYVRYFSGGWKKKSLIDRPVEKQVARRGEEMQ